MGGIKSNPCDQLAIGIWLWATAKNIWLSAVYTPGLHNVEDNDSRDYNNVE